MAKNFRNVNIIIITVIIVILTLFIWNKHNIKSVNTENNIAENNQKLVYDTNHYTQPASSAESSLQNRQEQPAAQDSKSELHLNQKSVYDTNQYQSYKQFTHLIGAFPPEALEYKGEISIGDTNYYQYGNEVINVEVISIDSYNEKNMRGPVEYIVSYRDRTFTFQENIPLHPGDVVIYYVDINKDNTKDVIIKGEPYSGSNVAYYWMRAVNLIYMEEIEVFKTTGDVRLTTEQSDTLNKMLETDIKFQSIFPDYEWLGNRADTMVDYFGNIYYEIGLGKEIFYDLGQILLLFDYNKITRKYDLIDYEYIPR